LSTAEQAAGRVGVTDFSKAAGIARDFNSIVRVSRNMEGQQALSEEWAHMIVRIQKNKNNPLISRAIEALSKNEMALQDILGDDF
jgi:division protein CdvB (Snf7/Vps24/ESCRT-III family)